MYLEVRCRQLRLSIWSIRGQARPRRQPADLCPSIVRLDPRTAQGSALKPKPNPICTQSRVKRVSAPDSFTDAQRSRRCRQSHKGLFVVACADDIAKHHHQGTHGRQDVARKLCSSAEASLSDRRTGKAGAVNYLDPPRSAYTITYLGHV